MPGPVLFHVYASEIPKAKNRVKIKTARFDNIENVSKPWLDDVKQIDDITRIFTSILNQPKSPQLK